MKLILSPTPRDLEIQGILSDPKFGKTCQGCGLNSRTFEGEKICWMALKTPESVIFICSNDCLDKVMQKSAEEKSVLQTWVMELPLKVQALMITAVRGPDGMPKFNRAKEIVKVLRGHILVCAEGDVGRTPFMTRDMSKIEFKGLCTEFFSDHDSVPHHFYMHLIHAAQAIGVYHPDRDIADMWTYFYLRACTDLHMNPETSQQFEKRMTPKNGKSNTVSELSE